jgi:ribosomal protein L12E/L44/L45/RPP1/RPP2
MKKLIYVLALCVALTGASFAVAADAPKKEEKKGEKKEEKKEEKKK